MFIKICKKNVSYCFQLKRKCTFLFTFMQKYSIIDLSNGKGRGAFKMKNLKKLIESYNNQAKSDWAIEEDMADMYAQDANDAEVVYNFITESKGVNIPTAAKYLNNLDTIVREAVCMAIAEDKGNDFLVKNFGWSVI